MITKQKLVDDIILRVTQGAPSDDLELEPSQIAHWFDLVAPTFLSDYLERIRGRGDDFDPILVEIEDNKTGVVENVTMLDDCNDRVYITTTKQIFEISNDLGLIRVIDAEGAVVNKVTLSNLDTVNKMRFSKPSRENMLYTRIGSKIYIHGLNPKHIGLTQFSVYYIPKIDISSLDPEDQVKLPDKLIGLISETVEEMAKKELYGSDIDLENDAEQDLNNG